MNSKHTQNVALKKYLLRALSHEDAEAIEHRYFTNTLFFNELRQAEIELICDYLDNRLNESERKQFENHYMRVPTLSKLVAEVDAQRTIVGRAAWRRRWLIGGALTAGCAVILGFAIILHYRPKTASVPVQSASVGQFPAGVGLVLTPGISKGAGQPTPALTLPDVAQPVFLAAQLPGQVSSAVYTVRLLNVDVEGAHKTIWSARDIRSTPQNGIQEVRIELPSTAITPGDYILELEMVNRSIRESYVFRMNPPPPPIRK